MYFIIHIGMAAAAVQDAGLTVRDVIRDLPTDPASLVALAFALGFIGAILYFGMRSQP